MKSPGTARCSPIYPVLATTLLFIGPGNAAPVVFTATPHETLARAIRADDLDAAQTVLAESASVHGLSGRLPLLSLAAIRGHTSMVELLVHAGAEPNAAGPGGANALSTAIRSCMAGAETLRILIEAGAEIENLSGAGLTPLLLAIQERRTDMALQLLEPGADVNALNPFGEGPLNCAIYTHNPEFIHALLARGADGHAGSAVGT